jgi:carbohydrate-selective porin OprB
MLQPDIQYVFDPGVNPNLDDAIILGLRVALSF